MPVSAGQPGKRRAGDDLAPIFRLEINDTPLNYDINRLIQTVEYESAIGMADMFKVTIDNPGLIDDTFPDWTGHKAFQPGNEATLYMGYGTTLGADSFVGRVFWVKHLPQYPTEGMPQLEVKGYDLSHKLMDNEGPVVKAGKNVKPTTARPVEQADDQGQVFQSILHSEVVSRIADIYGLEKDIDVTTKRDHLIVKKGKKHFELIKGLANLNNFDFWIDYNIKTKKWVIHWKKQNRSQGPQYVFRYGSNKSTSIETISTAGTLLSCQPEYGLRETVSTATILFFNEKTQQWISAIEIEDASGPDPIFKAGGGVRARAAVATRPRAGAKKPAPGKPRKEARATQFKRQAKDVIEEGLDSATLFRIAAGDVSIDVVPTGIRFDDPTDAAQYLLRWFKMKQDNFITLKGTTIGVETLRARQVHTIKGLGQRLDGDYFFTRVTHRMADSNYECEFTANKVIQG